MINEAVISAEIFMRVCKSVCFDDDSFD